MTLRPLILSFAAGLCLSLYPSHVLSQEQTPEGSEEVCKVIISDFVRLQDQIGEELEKLALVEKGLKEERRIMDVISKASMNVQLGEISQADLDHMQKRSDKPLSRDQAIDEIIKLKEEDLKSQVDHVERLKAWIRMKKEDIRKISLGLEVRRGKLVRLGCQIPPEKTFNLPKPEIAPEKKPKPEGKPADPYESFLGNWNGTAKITKCNEPKYVGMSSPYTLSITKQGGALSLTDNNGHLGDPSANRLKVEGSTLRVDYSGPPSLVVPQVETTLTFTLLVAVKEDKLTGTISTTTTSNYEGPAGTGSATVFAEMALELTRAK